MEMCVKGKCKEFTRVFMVASTSPYFIFSKVTWGCHVFRNVRIFYEECDKMCLCADDRRMYKL